MTNSKQNIATPITIPKPRLNINPKGATMNNTPDYNDNIAFKPELTWEELCEWIGDRAELGYFKSWFDMSYNDSRFTFYNSGDVVVNGITIAEKKTPAQMKTIIEALWG